MALDYHFLDIQYGGPIDVIFPVIVGSAFLGFAALMLRGGAQGERDRYAVYEELYERGPRWRWLRPRRFLPERFDGAVALVGGISMLGMAVLFFGIALSVAVE